ncbi:MAG: hypothetical protein JW820_19085 [Spirochaetales bacterium]|nr:hypothetical protein [Spirochaetales bacterium]
MAGKPAAWVYFSHNWYRSRGFPADTAAWIRDRGSTPFIRLMLSSSPDQNRPEGRFSLNRILQGAFDPDLCAWARGAREFDEPLFVEFGTEVNGRWFPWNGWWNGRDRLEQYYPGDDYVDCLGVNVYGALTPMEKQWPEFRRSMDAVYPRLSALAPTKPVLLLEFGAAAKNPLGDQAEWAGRALTYLVQNCWAGFSARRRTRVDPPSLPRADPQGSAHSETASSKRSRTASRLSLHSGKSAAISGTAGVPGKSAWMAGGSAQWRSHPTARPTFSPWPSWPTATTP